MNRSTAAPLRRVAIYARCSSENQREMSTIGSGRARERPTAEAARHRGNQPDVRRHLAFKMGDVSLSARRPPRVDNDVSGMT